MNTANTDLFDDEADADMQRDEAEEPGEVGLHAGAGALAQASSHVRSLPSASLGRLSWFMRCSFYDGLDVGGPAGLIGECLIIVFVQSMVALVFAEAASHYRWPAASTSGPSASWAATTAGGWPGCSPWHWS